MADFLFDSSGDWITWRRTSDARFLFNNDGDAIGWFPWGDADAVNMDRASLGTVLGNRLLRKHNQPYRGYPGYAGHISAPAGFTDVPKSQIKT